MTRKTSHPSLPLLSVFLLGLVLLNPIALSANSENQFNIEEFENVPDGIWVNHDTRILTGMDLEQYYKIINNLRCPVCQGQSIAESDSEISIDLKSMVYQKIAEGLSESEIKALLSERYGFYIDFEPPINRSTAPLWFFPFLIAIGGVLFVVYRSRTRRKFEKWT